MGTLADCCELQLGERHVRALPQEGSLGGFGEPQVGVLGGFGEYLVDR